MTKRKNTDKNDLNQSVNMLSKSINRASFIFNHISQCGILEINTSGNCYVVLNHPSFGKSHLNYEDFTLDPRLTSLFNLTNNEDISTLNSNEGIQFIHKNEKSLFKEKLFIYYGFYYTEKINVNINRHYFFNSQSIEIYNLLTNNVELFYPFIKYFSLVNQEIFNYAKETASRIKKFEDTPIFKLLNQKNQTPKDEISKFLNTFNLPSKNELFSDKQFQCLQLYYNGTKNKTIAKILKLTSKKMQKLLSTINE